MEAGELAIYMFSTCLFATFVTAPSVAGPAPIQADPRADGLSYRSDRYRDGPVPIGSAVWRSLQSRVDSCTLSARKTETVGRTVLFYGAILRRDRGCYGSQVRAWGRAR
jgi:hypothetical protein